MAEPEKVEGKQGDEVNTMKPSVVAAWGRAAISFRDFGTTYHIKTSNCHPLNLMHEAGIALAIGATTLPTGSLDLVNGSQRPWTLGMGN